MSINSERNLTMLMDFYELTMANGYYALGKKEDRVVFDMFYRKNPDNGGFVIAAGLAQFIEYLQDFHFEESDIEYLRHKNIFSEDFLTYLKTAKFTGNVVAVPEGTIVYPNTPLVTVEAPLCEAQLIETMLLLSINHQSLIATKANRMVRAAHGKSVADFGARRAHSYDAALYGARAAYIGGVDSTATVSAEQEFGIGAGGTMAHSWIQYFESEFEAFKAYALTYPRACTLLVDTYDVLKSGIPNVIRVQKEILEPMGQRVQAVRLDSGDLAYLSKKVRKMLDAAGMTETKIVVSNSIDETILTSLFEQGAMIDSFGIGERLMTARSEPVFGGVYKLVAVQENGQYSPRIKISENIEKITHPGFKKLYRVVNQDGIGIFDFLALHDEVIDLTTLEVVDQEKPWKKIELDPAWTIEELQKPIILNGKLVAQLPTVQEIRAQVQENLKHVAEEEKRFENPHRHYVDLTRRLYETKLHMLQKNNK